jgi:hypothetical protein
MVVRLGQRLPWGWARCCEVVTSGQRQAWATTVRAGTGVTLDPDRAILHQSVILPAPDLTESDATLVSWTAIKRVAAGMVFILSAVASIYQFSSASERHQWLYLLYGVAALIGAIFLLTPFFPDWPPQSGSGWTQGAFATLAVVAIGFSGFGFGAMLNEGGATELSAPVSPSPQPAISVDPADDLAGQIITVSGSVSNLPIGETLWVFVSDPGKVERYLQRGPCILDEGKTRWQCQGIALGVPDEPAGRQFIIHVARVNSEKAREFVEVWNGIERDMQPDGTSAGYAKRAFKEWPFGVVPSEPVDYVRSQ